ncbi:MAG: hypothetical protein LUH63_13010 [Parabacteroides sp.]|nr:hypothetical protein [Parabacteroides sp.]
MDTNRPNDSLTAKIFDASGEVISQATFKPKKKEEEFSIIGSWEGPQGALELELPEVYKDLEDTYTFHSDGTFEYVFNSSKELGRGHVMKHGEMIWYWIGYRYEITKGTYHISNSQLTTNCTYHHEEFEHDYEFLDGTKGTHESYKSDEGIGKDLIGGKIEIIDNKTLMLHKPNGEKFKLQKIQ